LSIEHRRTKTVFAAIQKLIEQGAASFRPGGVTSALRDGGQPMGAWEVRGEFSILEAEGLIELDVASGAWSLSEGASKKATG
jgi:hypothetical protein